MEYELNILGEFKNKEIENTFLEDEVKKGLKLTRYIIFFASFANLLIGIPDYIMWKDINIEIINFVFFLRIIIVVIAIIFISIMKRIKNLKLIGFLTYTFALTIYVSHLCVAFNFVPIPIMFETFNLIILSTCLFLIPNRWALNLFFSLAYFALYIIIMPHLCTTTSSGERIIAISYVCWNTIIICVLFYRINIYKRNHFSKTLQLEQLANTDHLTKIHNRKACDDILDSACKDNATFSFILFDIDNFKYVNDTYGHVAGDEVIVSITKYVKKIIRKNDILARWGGEEFVLIMPGAKLNDAAELAKRVGEQILRIKHANIKQNITCSFGVTSFIKGDTATSLTKRADQLLYLAKEYGKNRVVAG